MDITRFINSEIVLTWFLGNGVRIVLVLAGAFVVYQIAKTIFTRAVRIMVEQTYEIRDGEAMEKRNETLMGVVVTTLRVAVMLLAGLIVLSELGVNIAPLLAGAGIAGLAIGFGAQNLVKNTISGLFILLEDQYRKEDMVKIAGITGIVEDVNFRRTVLRDLEGVLHYVPNGEISVASNFTKPHSQVNIDIPVVYDADIERTIDVLNRIGRELRDDPHFGQSLIKPLEVLGVDELGDSKIKIRVGGTSKALKHLEVAREFRRRVLKEGVMKRTS